MDVTVLRDTTNIHRVAFLVNLNSYSISSFHVISSLTGQQNYDTEITGWTRFKVGDPLITVTSYSTEDWRFDANSGTFWWQNFENVNNLGDPGYKLIFRVQNRFFDESTTFKYQIDQVPEPASLALVLAGLAVVSLLKSRHQRV